MSVLERLSPDNRLFGIPIQHSFASLYILDLVFDQFDFAQVVELGTYRGALSTFLWLECQVRGHRFLSVDRADKRVTDLFPFLRGDIFECQRTKLRIFEFLGQAPSFLYCDDGNKPREIQVYAPVLPPRSVLGVHDWGTEISEKDVSFLADLSFHPIDDINCLSTELHTLQQFWVRR
ncbi:hypothetical protein J7J18_06805 [bacterium]|nr:hypothetical protein [bacterium]